MLLGINSFPCLRFTSSCSGRSTAVHVTHPLSGDTYFCLHVVVENIESLHIVRSKIVHTSRADCVELFIKFTNQYFCSNRMVLAITFPSTTKWTVNQVPFHVAHRGNERTMKEVRTWYTIKQ
jgi:tRNA(Phe) wybutosine-synthesizing methylase Tyw3